MIAVVGGVKTLVNVKMTPPERDLEKQKKQDEDALIAAGINMDNLAGGGEAVEESPEDARFRRYYEAKMREQAAGDYWNEVGLGSRDFGGYTPVDGEDTDIRTSSSGCSYTVAKLLADKGEDVAFVSVVGKDALGLAALCSLEQAGADVSAVKTLEWATPVSVEIHNIIGDLEFCRENNRLMEAITPEYIDQCADVLEGAEGIFLDGSLPVETLNYISEKYADRCKIFFDPSSIQGGGRFAESDLRCHMVLPGRMEAEAMTGLQVLGLDQLMEAGCALEERGVERTVVTLKGGGLYYKEGPEAGIIKPPAVLNFVDTKGAGDVISAEMVYRIVKGEDFPEAAQHAIDAAAEYLKDAESTKGAVK